MSHCKVHNTHAHTVTSIRQVCADVASERHNPQRRRQRQMLALCRARLLVTSRTGTHQAPLSVGFPRQEHWSGLPFPSPGNLPNPGMGPGSPALAGGLFTIWATREAQEVMVAGVGVGGVLKPFRRNCECKTISVMILRQHLPFTLCSTCTDGVNATVGNDCRGNQGRGTRLHSWLLCTYSQKKKQFPEECWWRRNSLAVRWLGFCTSNAGTQVPSLVWELRSLMPHATTEI